MGTLGSRFLALSITAAFLALVVVQTGPLSWSGLLTPITRIFISHGRLESIPEPGLGLKCFYEGKDATVDIVFVHGLNGDRERTWNASNGIIWPKDLLPFDLPRSRIYSWGYDARVASFGQISEQYLHSDAESLVSHLEIERRNTKTIRRPIIFLAHSLGGLLVKRALIYSHSARDGFRDHHGSIKRSTHAVYFFGTPHQGSEGTSIATELLNIGRLFINTNKDKLAMLTRDSEQLQLINEGFLPLRKHLETKYFFELRKTKLPGGSSMIIVPKSSAALPGDEAESIGLHADHRNMIRFPSRDSETPSYRSVLGHLASSVDAAPESIARNWATDDKWKDFNSPDSANKVDFDVEFHVPLKRSAYFIGRDKAISELHEAAFSSQGGRDRRMTKTIAVTGIGGIGKSQLVVEFIHVYREKFQSVLWINCASNESILNDFEAAALELKAHLKGNEKSRKLLTDFESAGNKDTKRQTAAVQLIQKWLSQVDNSHWLVVFDGLDALDELAVNEYLPEAHAGHVIITSRSRTAETYAKGGPSLRLELLSPEDAASFLLQSADMAKSVTDVSNDVSTKAHKVAYELGYLPLGLEVAGAYLNHRNAIFDEHGVSLIEPGDRLDHYIQLLNSSFEKVINYKPDGEWQYKEPLVNAWKINLDRIQSRNPTAIRLLSVFGMLGTDALSLDVLQPLVNFDPSLHPNGQGLSTLKDITTKVLKKFDADGYPPPSFASAIADFNRMWEKASPQTFGENLKAATNLLYDYSLAKQSSSGGIIIHRMVLRWAKERLDDTQKMQAARDTVLSIAQYNHKNTEFYEGKWITRDFAQKFVDWNMRCFQLVNGPLMEEVRNSPDWALLLAVERLAMDFFYSKRPDQTHYLINALMENPKMATRAVGMAMSVQYYRLLGSFPSAVSVHLNWDGFKDMRRKFSGEMDELAWLWAIALKRREFKERNWAEWYAKNPGGEETYLLPRILLNITRLERMIVQPVVHPDVGQRRRGEIIKVKDVFQELVMQLGGLVESRIPGPFLDSLEDVPQLLVRYLNHPLVQQMLSEFPDDLKASGVSYLAIGFRLDYILSRYDRAMYAFWNQTLTLHKEHRVLALNRPLQTFLAQQHELEKMRTWIMTKDHPIYPKRHQFYLDIAAEAYSKQEMIKKLESDFADVAIATDDLGPSAVAMKNLLFNKIFQLNTQLMKEHGAKACFSPDLLLFAELLFFERKREPDVPSFGGEESNNKTEREVLASRYRKVIGMMCNTTRDAHTPPTSTFFIKAKAALRKYISSSAQEAGSWPIPDSLKPSPESEAYQNPVGIWKLVSWVSVLGGRRGFFLRAFIVRIVSTFWPMLPWWPASFVTHWVFPWSMSPRQILIWLFTDFLGGLVVRTAVDVVLAEMFPAYQLGWFSRVVFEALLYLGFLVRKARRRQ